jgi:hypothetical protein
MTISEMRNLLAIVEQWNLLTLPQAVKPELEFKKNDLVSVIRHYREIDIPVEEIFLPRPARVLRAAKSEVSRSRS